MTTDHRSPATFIKSAGGVAALLVLAAVMLMTATSADAAKRKLSPAKAVALEKRLGHRASGTYLDRRTGNMVINVSDAATARRVRKAGAIAKIVPRSARLLERIVKRLARSKPVGNTAWRIDPVKNRVVLSIAKTVSAKDRKRLTRLVRPYGRAVRIETIAPIRPVISGGDAIHSAATRCSLGFNVTVRGVDHFLTAGHCTAKSANWSVPAVAVDTRYPNDDYALVRYTDSAPSRPSNVNLYDNGRVQDITGAGEAVVNQQVSKSGSTTGLTRGTVLATNVTIVHDIKDGPDLPVGGMVETNACVRPGDSGGALFAGAIALGITSAATECDANRRSYFNAVVEALQAYGAQIPLGNRAPVITSVSPAAGAVVGSNTPRLDAAVHDPDGEAVQRSYRITGPSTDISSGWVGGAWTVPAHRLDPGTRYDWKITVRDARGAVSERSAWLRVGMLPTASDMVSVSTGDGYWQVASDGGVFSFGTARFFGSLPGLGVKVTNIIGMARTADDGGYWLVGRDGGVFAFGNAPFAGSLPGLGVSVDNIVGMAPTRDGRGYWLVGSDGGVFAFGSAQFYGSMGGKPLNAPVARMAPTASGNGYWLVARDGGVFSFGDAPFYGSMGGKPLNAPVIDVDIAPHGDGYWLTAEDGGVFAFGSAPFHGSAANTHLHGRITSMSPTPDGGGYWLTGCDGGVFSFGNAQFFGSDPRYGCRGT